MTKIIAYSLLITATSFSVLFTFGYTDLAHANISKIIHIHSIPISRDSSADHNQTEIEELNSAFDKELSPDIKLNNLKIRLFDNHFHSKPMTK